MVIVRPVEEDMSRSRDRLRESTKEKEKRRCLPMVA